MKLFRSAISTFVTYTPSSSEVAGGTRVVSSIVQGLSYRGSPVVLPPSDVDHSGDETPSCCVVGMVLLKLPFVFPSGVFLFSSSCANLAGFKLLWAFRGEVVLVGVGLVTPRFLRGEAVLDGLGLEAPRFLPEAEQGGEDVSESESTVITTTIKQRKYHHTTQLKVHPVRVLFLVMAGGL